MVSSLTLLYAEVISVGGCTAGGCGIVICCGDLVRQGRLWGKSVILLYGCPEFIRLGSGEKERQNDSVSLWRWFLSMTGWWHHHCCPDRVPHLPNSTMLILTHGNCLSMQIYLDLLSAKRTWKTMYRFCTNAHRWVCWTHSIFPVSLLVPHFSIAFSNSELSRITVYLLGPLRFDKGSCNKTS